MMYVQGNTDCVENQNDLIEQVLLVAMFPSAWQYALLVAQQPVTAILEMHIPKRDFKKIF